MNKIIVVLVRIGKTQTPLVRMTKEVDRKPRGQLEVKQQQRKKLKMQKRMKKMRIATRKRIHQMVRCLHEPVLLSGFQTD